MRRSTYALLFTLVAATLLAGGEAGFSRKLAEEAKNPPAGSAGTVGFTSFVAKKAKLKDGELTLEDVSPTTLAYNPGTTPVPSVTSDVIGLYVPGQKVWAILAAAPPAGGDGSVPPKLLLVRASDPVLHGSNLKLKAEAVAPDAAAGAAPQGGSIEGGLKMIQAGASGGPAAAVGEWEAIDVSLTVDNVPPAEGPPPKGAAAQAGGQ